MTIKKPSMMKLVLPKKYAKKEQAVVPQREMASWIGLALQQHYMESRPLWMTPRAVEKGWTPSSLGEPNDRLMVAALLGYRDLYITEKLRRIFDAGNDIEARWGTRFKDIGVLEDYSDSQKWLPNNMGSPLKFSGKWDLLVRHKFETDRRFLVEVKSISPEGFMSLPMVSMNPQTNFRSFDTG